jgi:FkbM family methyltransferase
MADIKRIPRTLKKVITKTSQERKRRRRRIVEAQSVFENWEQFRTATVVVDGGESILRSKSGVNIAVRHNKWDAEIVGEQFFDRSYLKHMPSVNGSPVIVDVGGYIGDFGLYCAHELDARVVIYEPAAENFHMLLKNVELNPSLAEHITVVNKGVSTAPTVVSNVQKLGSEIHVSSEMYGNDPRSEQRIFECHSLSDILAVHEIETVDLLKVDCEGGEYDIFSQVTSDTYNRIRSIVFEWHPISGWEQKLAVIMRERGNAGYRLEREGQLQYAYRS